MKTYSIVGEYESLVVRFKNRFNFKIVQVFKYLVEHLTSNIVHIEIFSFRMSNTLKLDYLYQVILTSNAIFKESCIFIYQYNSLANDLFTDRMLINVTVKYKMLCYFLQRLKWNRVNNGIKKESKISYDFIDEVRTHRQQSLHAN